MNKTNYILKMTCLLALLVVTVPPCFSQECNKVYVTVGGSDTGSSGTKSNPASLLYGLSLTSSTNNKMLLAYGTYIITSPLVLKSNISIEGGFNPATWNKSNGNASIIYRDNSNVESSPNRLAAIYGDTISDFRLQDITIQCSNSFGNGISTYGVHLSGCNDYGIIRCNIISGSAGNGTNGTSGTNGIMGNVGTSGDNGDEQGPCCRLGGIGASGSFIGSNAGGNGGDGGDRGSASCSFCGNPSDATNGYAGYAGIGPGGGVPGNGGARIVVCIYPLSCARTTNNDGQFGSNGIDGSIGTTGFNGAASHGGGFFIPQDGGTGTDGTNGSGAGGGGGGGSLGGIPYDCLFGLPPNFNGTGAGGGGGGEGGQGGGYGSGGTGGGSSFALYIDNNGANGIVKDCNLSAGSSGLGGIGGAGGAGGPGGAGGLGGGQSNCSIGAGGNGGTGGNGGVGGAGGNGSNGISQNFYEDPSGTPVNLLNIYSLQQPFVSINYSGCTESPIEFSTTSFGSTKWFFGAGANPPSSTSNPAIVKYTSQGLKTFTLVSNGIPYTYTEFLSIKTDGSGLNPSILSTSDSLCEGDFGSFSTTISADNYEWLVLGDTLTDTLVGPGLSSITYGFDSTGTYDVLLTTYNDCCGPSFQDTFSVFVKPVVFPSVNIVSSDTTNLICKNETIVFTASAQNTSSALFSWMVNGSIVFNGNPIYTTASLSTGDIINCIALTTSGCSAGLLDTSNSISITVVSPPSVSCYADSFIANVPTYFSATVDSGGLHPFYFSWDFGDGSHGNGDSIAHIYLNSGTYDVQATIIDSNGCTGICNTNVAIISTLNSGFYTDPENGCAPLDISFYNTSSNAITYLWDFGDGSTSVLENPAHTYVNPGTYDVTLSAFGTTGNINTSISGQIVVLPRPLANLQAFPELITEPNDTVFFADNSLDASSWYWNFGDPSSGNSNFSSLQNPAHIYTQNGNYTVTLVVEASNGCSDSISIQDFISVSIDSSGPLSLSDSDFNNSEFSVFPNPFESILNLTIKSKTNATISFSLYNSQGAIMFSASDCKPSYINETIKIQMPAESFTSGLYFLSIIIDDNRSLIKLIKNN